MTMNQRAFRRFVSFWLTVVLCLAAGMTVFASDAVSGQPENSQEQSGQLDDDMAEAIALIGGKYGTEAAASFEKLVNHSEMQSLVRVLKSALQEEFPGLSSEEILEKMDAMSESERADLMEAIIERPEINALFQQVSEDEELAEEIANLTGAMFGNLIDGTEDDTESEKLTENVSGTQGEGISWKLDTKGTLTISGSGAIVPDYEEWQGLELAVYGWDDYLLQISKVVVKDGITVIPEEAFTFASNLTAVYLPASVTALESLSFAGCEKLSAVYFYGNAPAIAEDAFEECAPNLIFNSSGAAVSSQGAETGDDTFVSPYFLFMSGAAAVGGALFTRMRKKKA